MSTSNYSAELGWLFAQKPRGRTYGIDRMRAFAAALGHPERAGPCIHVAGTNGKGSVAAMLEAIFRAAGFRVGLYTSPHLVHVGERVQVDRVPLSEAEVVSYVRELRPVADRIGGADADLAPTFFEYLTAIAFLEFGRRRCDLAIYEVGLGGRLDATNVVTPTVTVITSIGLDHCEILGDTVEQIAAEKAGIVKPRIPLVVGRVPAGARGVIAQIAEQRAAPVEWVEDRFDAGGEPLPTTNLGGEFQRWNAATATLAARRFGFEARAVSANSLQATAGRPGGSVAARAAEAIASGLRNVQWAGRWERRNVGGLTLILDASHNPEGADTLAANLGALAKADGCKPAVIVGVLGAKRARPLLEAIARHAAAIYLVVPNDARACSCAELRALIPANFAGDVVDDSVARLFPGPGVISLRRDAAAPAQTVASIVVTGSIYLVGEVMRRLQ